MNPAPPVMSTRRPIDSSVLIKLILNESTSSVQAARRTVETTYDLDTCVNRLLALMDLVASGSISG